ncbi:MAG: HU family DNA-binding protein [Pseudonocardia sediminis]
MNKAQLVEALTARLGDRRTAAAAVDGVVEVIVETVGAGDSVTLTGFGVFEARRRAARVARNPRTGETVPVAETVVPSFRPGAAFRERIEASDAAAAGATSAPRRPPRTATRTTRTDGVTQIDTDGSRTASGRKPAAKRGARASPKETATSPAKAAGTSAADKGSTSQGATAKAPATKSPAKKSTTTSTSAAAKSSTAKTSTTAKSSTTAKTSTMKKAPTRRPSAEK